MGVNTTDRLLGLLPWEAAALLEAHREDVTEVRLRANRPAQVVWMDGSALVGEPLDADGLRRAVAALMDYSFYAHEAELAQGFFTMNDGCRVGVCGRFTGGDGDRLTDIGSVCVRVARSLPGCADGIMGSVMTPGGLRSTLLVSLPGLGKTTLLRDIARQLSEAGRCVAIADERHEVAACRAGVPTLDVGPRTDVLDGCPRPQAIRQLIRAMAPEVIVADEIGGPGDAEALSEAVRCGVAVVASAHAGSLEAALMRPCLRDVLEGGAIKQVALLGDGPGQVKAIHRLEVGGDGPWRSG